MDIVVFSVYEVSMHLKQVIESQIEEMYVGGEISNFVHHASGHIYFNLKDENATLRCTFFRGQNYNLTFKPQDGMQVVCFGKLSIFEKGGTYNLNVKTMSLAGVGNLAQQFELLKKKLHSEGLFESSHKKALPPYPQKIGIVTSPTGAALQDIKNILSRRFPVEFFVYPALVQGNEAPAQIVEGIGYFDLIFPVDVIIISRGGGSQEDLFCFNDEKIARAIFAARTPIISAIGHEIDFTIADFVADLRAPTPSAAAELVVPDKKDILLHLESTFRRINLSLDNRLGKAEKALYENRMLLSKYHPEKMWQSYQQRCDMASMQLSQINTVVNEKKKSFEMYQEKITAQIKNILFARLYEYKHRQQDSSSELSKAVLDSLTAIRKRFEDSSITLEQQSPKRILSRGYAILQKDDKVVSSIRDLKPGDELRINIQDGVIDADVRNTQ